MPARLPTLVRRVTMVVFACCVFVLARAANEARPVVGPGATKDEVINAYGWPNGQSQSGTKEILSYAQGEVVLENGRVERVNFSPNVPWQAPRPRPAPPTASTRKVPEAPVDYWVTSFDAAIVEAQRRNSRILALFTGSDWSPASRQFHDEVEYHPDFINAFAGDFVFAKFDYPRGAPVPAKISEENLRLRDRYAVTTYPTLLILSSTGNLLARVDLDKGVAGATFRDRVIAAVRQARGGSVKDVPTETPKATSQAVAAAKATPAPGARPAPATVSDIATTRAMGTAGRLIMGALIAGGLLVAVMLWRLWRRPANNPQPPVLTMADRIDAAGGGMPTVAEMNGWTKEKLRAITAAVVEFDGYSAHQRPPSEEVDIELRKRGDLKPRILVCCSPGSVGVVAAKPLRELFGTLAAEGVDNGWFVSPAGFSNDAREYAAAHRITLVNSEGLHAMMREVPPVSLPRVLATT